MEVGIMLQIMLLAMMVVVVTTTNNTQTDYRACHTTKGQAKLYNCGRKYDKSNNATASLQSFTSPTRYIVKLKDGVPASIVDKICTTAETNKTAYPGYCTSKYKTSWMGMLMVISGGNLSRLLNQEGSVIGHVEVEGTASISTSTAAVVTMSTANPANVTEKYPPSWGLDRIDHTGTDPLLNNLYTVSGGGDGVHVYIIDTGIRCTHSDFLYGDGRLDPNTKKPMSRCLTGFDGIGDGYGTNDCNGHGTHCAGVVAGLQSGVAKNAYVHPIRALGCDGTGGYGTIMEALDWIYANAITPAIISMSLAAPASISIDQSITNLMTARGILAVVASGNFQTDACQYSPARVVSALTVSSMASTSLMSWFSDYGTCTDIFAPGELIISAWNTSDTAWQTLSGTSMATPHVAGSAALYLSQTSSAMPQDVKQALLDACEPTAVLGVQPFTTTKLLNVANLKQPNFVITPRTFYNMSEGTTQTSVISIKLKPTNIVQLLPTVDPTIGYFTPSRIYFATDATWSLAQAIQLTLLNRSDCLDHSSVILWAFTSLDTRYTISPQGYVTSLDTSVCKWSASNPCGQTVDNAKIIPVVPFTYFEDSMKYQNNYDTDVDYCHSNGPDVVFQLTPNVSMTVMISLNGSDTDYDTILSAYQKTPQKSGPSLINLLACNDDSWGVISIISTMNLKAGVTYVFIVDGWGTGGRFDFILTQMNVPVVKIQDVSISLPTTTIQISTQSQNHTACTLWNSRPCDENLPPRGPPQNNYYWGPAYWGPCNHSCGGGNQTAVMRCYVGNYVETDLANCATLLPPTNITQSCNVVECRFYMLYEGPWGECNQTCGSGIQTRVVMCIDNLGNTAHPNSCSPQYEQSTKLQFCNIQACNHTYWEVPNWSNCNVPCGSGRKFRDAVCLSVGGGIVDESRCYQLPPAPLLDQACNTHPCQTYAWLVGPWNDCPNGCNVNQTRLVECVDGVGDISDIINCDPEGMPTSSIPCKLPNVTCNDCIQNNCSGHGNCVGGQCVCIGNWEGTHCEILQSCMGRPVGYIDTVVSCCPYPTRDIFHHCCATSDAVLDIDGMCCEGGALDACGYCNGTAKSIDSQNTCCATIRDEKGLCCNSGMMDECHICDGDGTSCATNITIHLIFNSDLSIPRNTSIEWKAFMFVFITNVANKLGLAMDALLLTNVHLANIFNGDCTEDYDRAEGCLLNGVPEVLGTFNFTLLPKPAVHLEGMVTNPQEIAMNIASIDFSSPIYTDTSDSFTTQDSDYQDQPMFSVLSVDNVQKAGICGNNVCEQGERCDPKSRSAMYISSLCCLVDCPYVSITCPIPLTGPNAYRACSGKGVCLDASGQCSCFLGYMGTACEQCMFGYTNTFNGSLCVKLATPAEFVAMGLYSDSTLVWQGNGAPTNQSGTNVLTVVIVVTLLSVAGYYGYHWRKSRNAQQPYRHHRLNTNLNNPSTNLKNPQGQGEL